MYPKDRADESNYARYIELERPPLAQLAKARDEFLKSAGKLFDLSFSTACSEMLHVRAPICRK